MGLARELQLQVNFTSRGARGLHRDLAVLTRDLRGLERRPGQRSMAISYGAEQAASQINRVTTGVRRGLEATAGLAADFEDQMGRVASIATSGKGPAEAAKIVHDLSTEARRLGETTRYTAREAAAGMYELAQAGYDAEKTIKTMPAVLSLATVGNIEIARAAEITTGIMGGFNIEADKSAQVIDRLASAIVSGNLGMEDLGVAMSYAAPKAKDLNQDLESMAGWMAVLSDAGIKGSKAGTGTRSILGSLEVASSGTTAAAKRKKAIFDKHGVALTDDQGNLRDATAILGELGLAMARSGASNTEKSGEILEIFGKNFGTSASVLMSSSAKGLGAMDKDLASLSALMGRDVTEEQREKIWEGESLQSRIGRIRESDGVAAQMAAHMEKTTKGQWREFQSVLEETGIILGEQVLPTLAEGMRELKPILLGIGSFAKRHPELVKGLAKFMLAVVAAGAIAVPVLHTFSALAGLAGLGGRIAGGLGMGRGFVGPVGGGVAMLGAAGGGSGGGGRPSRSQSTMMWHTGEYRLTDGFHGPAVERTVGIQRYNNTRGFGIDERGVMGWHAGGDSPDGVWASPEAEVAQRKREREARRRSRGLRGFGFHSRFGKSSRGYALYQQQQANLRRAARAEARMQRQQNRANRRAARRANGISKAGGLNTAMMAAMGFGIGEAIGHGLNLGLKKVMGTSATEFISGWLDDFDRTSGGKFQNWLEKKYGVESDPEAEKIALTNVRGGAKRLTDLHGHTKESMAEEQRLRAEQDKTAFMARELGVSTGVIRRARDMGVTDEKMLKNKGWMQNFAMQEQARDAEQARLQEEKKKRDALATLRAQEAWALAKQGGANDEKAHKIGDLAAKRFRGEKTGTLGGIFDGIAAAVQKGIVDGAKAAPALTALIPAAAVGGADAGG